MTREERPCQKKQSAQCQEIFNQTQRTGSEDTVRRRPDRQRLIFIYSVLAHPPTWKPSHDDVVDVVCRISYRYYFLQKPRGMLGCRPVTDFLPLAEGLEPFENAEEQRLLPVEGLAALKELVRVIAPPRRWNVPSVVDIGLGEAGELDGEGFVVWARKIRQVEGTIERMTGCKSTVLEADVNNYLPQ
ncbi:hypothetical protein CC80DRAFT_503497 [Byssothecium circinans]|uniref:Uncharacterized protein n=1 Tax=Byssothecium circinans TaxID=147558 RepID=A0A6A5U1Y4_9PLEO|nr:hypothetical protein CC80DRAFT_503497 [Byssothecium circinans]